MKLSVLTSRYIVYSMLPKIRAYGFVGPKCCACPLPNFPPSNP